MFCDRRTPWGPVGTVRSAFDDILKTLQTPLQVRTPKVEHWMKQHKQHLQKQERLLNHPSFDQSHHHGCQQANDDASVSMNEVDEPES